MKIGLTRLTPSLRELPVSLQLKNNRSKYIMPIPTNGYIIDPKKFKNEIKDIEINFKEIKYLLIMMLKGNPDFIKNLVKTDSNRFVNITA